MRKKMWITMRCVPKSELNQIVGHLQIILIDSIAFKHMASIFAKINDFVDLWRVDSFIIGYCFVLNCRLRSVESTYCKQSIFLRHGRPSTVGISPVCFHIPYTKIRSITFGFSVNICFLSFTIVDGKSQNKNVNMWRWWFRSALDFYALGE